MMPAPRRSVIPATAWLIAGIVFALLFLLCSVILLRENEAPVPVRILAPILLPLLVAAYIVAVGYVYGDSRRRGMRHVMWTLLAIFIPNGVGLILYFILRDPMPVYCSRCGHPMNSGFAFCPGCGSNILPACPGCHRTLQPGWTHCAWCGTRTVG
jgi:RNA polymerase subunit RPABC4/transcription elongation factor Spt4/putative effector of murein hydrolase LrgA (UPF0299 family)